MIHPFQNAITLLVGRFEDSKTSNEISICNFLQLITFIISLISNLEIVLRLFEALQKCHNQGFETNMKNGINS